MPHQDGAAGSPAENAPPDEVLLQRIVEGDVSAFDELFRRHRLSAYRVAWRLLGHEADALDAVQDSFVKVLRQWRQFRGRSSFRTWLLRVVSRTALDIGRQRQRQQLPPVPIRRVVACQQEPMDLIVHDDLQATLQAALAQLPEAQRQTFVLHVDGGLSYREIAEVLGISIGTVMSRLFHARQKLRRLLAAQVEP